VDQKTADRLRKKQDRLLKLVAGRYPDHYQISESYAGSPKISELRQFIFPEWESVIDAVIADFEHGKNPRARRRNPGIDVSGPIEEIAKAAAGNWKKFGDFGWHGAPDDADRYMIYNIRTRDSSLLEESNADYIERVMKKVRGVELQRHSHWAVGWTEALIVPVYDKKGKITAAFKKLVEIMQTKAEYQVLDEDDYSNREYDATLENIVEVGKEYVRADAPKNWPGLVYSYLSENDDSQIESRDDQGGYPENESVIAALHMLRLLDEDTEEELKDELPALPEPEAPGQMRMFNPRRCHA